MQNIDSNNILSPEFLAKKTFDLYQTFGIPIEISEQILEKEGLEINSQTLNELIENHQRSSQEASKGQFKSGLGEDNPKTRALHTTTHILHSVLRGIWGESARQMGSAIMEDKARFDISVASDDFDEAKTRDIEAKIQEIMDKDLKMQKIETDQNTAKDAGAIGLFGEKYADKVNVYILAENSAFGGSEEICLSNLDLDKVYSIEFCAGPHIQDTTEIRSFGKFKILKKKSIGQGLTRLEFDIQ